MTIQRILLVLAVGIFLTPAAYAQEVLTWEDCIKEAKKNHPDLIAGREDIIQREADIAAAMGEFVPHLSADLRGDSNHDDFSTSDSYSYGLSATQDINYEIFNEYQRARQALKTSRYIYMVQSSDVLMRLRKAFVSLLREQALVSVAEEIVQRRQANVDLVGQQHGDQGASLAVQANLAEAQAGLLDAQRRKDLAQRRLRKEMGHSNFTTVEVSGTFEATEPQRLAPDFVTIAHTTPLLKQMTSFTEEDKIGVRGAWGEYLPEIFISGDVGRSDGRWTPRKDSESWSVGASVELEIFDGGERHANLKGAKSRLRASQAVERSVHDFIIVTLNETWVDFQAALDDVLVQSKFVDSTTARANNGENLFRKGDWDFEDWIWTEDEYIDQKVTFVNAQADALLAEADWMQAKGETIEDF